MTGHRGVKWEDFVRCIAKAKKLHAAFILLNVSIVAIQGVDKAPQPNGAGSFYPHHSVLVLSCYHTTQHLALVFSECQVLCSSKISLSI